MTVVVVREAAPFASGTPQGSPVHSASQCTLSASMRGQMLVSLKKAFLKLGAPIKSSTSWNGHSQPYKQKERGADVPTYGLGSPPIRRGFRGRREASQGAFGRLLSVTCGSRRAPSRALSPSSSRFSATGGQEGTARSAADSGGPMRSQPLHIWK